MAKKIFLGIFIVILLLVLIVGIMFIPIKPKWFSEERHIENITKKVKSRYGTDDFTVSPLVMLGNKDTESRYFIVEFEESGFIIVSALKQPFGRMVRGYKYFCDKFLDGWQRYRPISSDEKVVFQDDRYWTEAKDQTNYSGQYFESDSSGQYTKQFVSPYKAAGVENETKYMLYVRQGDHGTYIPAVKRGDDYFNLVSLSVQPFVENTEEIMFPYIFINILPKTQFIL